MTTNANRRCHGVAGDVAIEYSMIFPPVPANQPPASEFEIEPIALPPEMPVPNHRPRKALSVGSEGKNRLVCRSLQRQVGIASKVSDGERSGALPECDDVGQNIESTPRLWRINHRRWMIGVSKTDANPNARRNGRRVPCGYRQTTVMRELALLQSGIDQIMAKDVARNYQGQHVSWPGR